MDKTKLAFKLLEWEMKKRELDEIASDITEAVLEIEKTQTVGNVRATYSGGRATYDYRQPGLAASKEIIDQYSHDEKNTDWEMLAKDVGYSGKQFADWTTIEIITDWKMVCKEADRKPIVLSRTDPSVKIKILE